MLEEFLKRRSGPHEGNIDKEDGLFLCLFKPREQLKSLDTNSSTCHRQKNENTRPRYASVNIDRGRPHPSKTLASHLGTSFMEPNNSKGKEKQVECCRGPEDLGFPLVLFEATPNELSIPSPSILPVKKRKGIYLIAKFYDSYLFAVKLLCSLILL